jgi:hypothetical protein
MKLGIGSQANELELKGLLVDGNCRIHAGAVGPITAYK